MIQIEGYDFNTLYRRALFELARAEPNAAPRGQRTAEVLGASLKLTDARRCLLEWPERKLNYHFLVAEWWWIATGRRDVASIAPYCSEIAKFSDDGENFFGAYGPPWTSQAQYVVDKLRQDPDSRQALLTIWRQNPPETRDVPCTVAMQYLNRDGALHAIVTMRSSDCWLGLPYDVFNFSRLLAMVAGELRLQVGSLQLNAGSFHLYERNRAAALALLDTHRPQLAGLAPHPPVAAALDDLPGLVPEELATQKMVGGCLVVPNQGSDSERPFAPYLAVLNHRYAKWQPLTAPWDRVLG